MRMIVVGGGLAGCLLALFLARRGFKVDVFERHSDERGASESKRPALNLTLCERGLAALGRVGAREKIERLAAPARGRIVHVDGETAFQPYGSEGEAIHSVSRSDLNDALLGLAEAAPGVQCHFSKRCLGVDLATGTVRFEDTLTHESFEVHGDAVFGADGAFSSVRAEFQRNDGFNFSQSYWRHGGYKSLFVPARPDGRPALQEGALHIWPRGERMLIGFPNRDGSMMLSLLLPFRGRGSHASLTNEAELVEFFRKNFPDVIDLIPGLADQYFAKPPNSLITIRCDPWSMGPKTLLIGDAAHAILPSYGQGANAAFEDCAVLDECLDELGLDFEKAFLAFERRRRPSLDVIADLCVEHFKELCELVAAPEFLRKKELERRLHEQYPTLYRSLYSMVTFSTMPYADALAVDLRQRATLDALMQKFDLNVTLQSADVRAALEQTTRGTA